MSPLPAPLLRTAADPEVLADDLPAPDAAHEARASRGTRPPDAALPAPRGGQMAAGEQFRVSVSHAARALMLRWRTLSQREGGLLSAVYHYGSPGSLAELDEYTKSRAWVPTGHDGGVSELAVVIWNNSAGRLGLALGLWIAWTAKRWYRGTATFLVLYALAAILAWAAGDGTLAIGMLAGLATFALAVYVTLRFLAGRHHQDHVSPPAGDLPDL